MSSISLYILQFLESVSVAKFFTYSQLSRKRRRRKKNKHKMLTRSFLTYLCAVATILIICKCACVCVCVFWPHDNDDSNDTINWGDVWRWLPKKEKLTRNEYLSLFLFFIVPLDSIAYGTGYLYDKIVCL